MKKYLAALTAIAVACASAVANPIPPTLVGSWPAAGGNITISSVGGPIHATGLDFTSTMKGQPGGLIPIGLGGVTASASPFTFLLANNAKQVRLGNLGTRVTIDGALKLALGAKSGAQVAATWGDGTRPVKFQIAPAISLASPIFVPGDPVLGGQSDGTTFTVGVTGTNAGVNNWPGSEGPEHAIDRVGQKYLNFGKTDTGILVTPTAGRSIINGIQFWAANDEIARDPIQYQLYGSNVDVDATSFVIAEWSEIATEPIALADARNDGGDAPLESITSAIATFSNPAAFDNYLILFNDVKDNAAANSMQIAEIQVYGQVIPEPSSGHLGLLLVPVLLRLRRRRRR